MGGLSQNLSFVLLGEDKSASKAMTDAEKTATRVSDRIGTSFQKVGGLLGGEFGGVLGEIGGKISELDSHAAHLGTTLSVGGGIATAAGIGLMNLGSGEQQATEQLNAAIKAAGDSAEEYQERIERTVRKNEDLDHSAIDTKNALQILTQQTGDTGKSLDTMSVVTDLAAAKHISLQDAATQVARIMSGSGGKTLAQYGITMDKTKSKTDAGKEALQQLAQKLDGQASSSVDNFGKQVDVAKTKITDWVEEISGPVGSVLTTAGPIITAAGIAVDLYAAKQERANAAAIQTAIVSVPASAGETAVGVAAGTAAPLVDGLTVSTEGLTTAMDLNPIVLVGGAIATLAIVAGGAILGSLDKQKQHVQDLTAAYKADGDQIGETTRQQVVHQLVTDGTAAGAMKLGVNLHTLTDAALGNHFAQKLVNDTLDRQRQSMDDAVNSADHTRAAHDELAKKQAPLRDAIEQVRGAVDAQNGAVKEAKKNTDLTNIAMGEGKGAAEHYGTAVHDLSTELRNIPKAVTSNITIQQSGSSGAGIIGRHAGGGDIGSSQLSTINEEGPEVVRLPGGAHVYTAAQSARMGGGRGGGDIHVHIEPPHGLYIGSADQMARQMTEMLITALRSGQVSKTEIRNAIGNAV